MGKFLFGPSGVLMLISMLCMLASGCMQSVEVPRNDWDSKAQWRGEYQVRTTSRRYIVREFSITDSTLEITALSGADGQFGKLDMPFSVPRNDVQSVKRVKSDPSKTGLVLILSAAAFVGLYTWAITSGEKNDY